MASATIALACGKGEAVQFPLVHQTSATNTAPINITGWTIAVTVRDTNGTVQITKTATVDNGPSGTYHFNVAHSDTLLPFAQYGLDIWRTDTGAETLMGYGTFSITPEVKY